MPKKDPKNKTEIEALQSGQRIELVERLIASPVVQMLLQLVPVAGPATAIAIATALDQIARERMHIFLEELSKGNIDITKADLSSREFLHSWMCTLNYAIRERREEKIRLFADLFRGYCQNRCFDEDADIYEEHLEVLEDLSYREFQILCILYEFQNDAQRDFWGEFFDSLESKLHISRNEIPAILQRLNRTGLYQPVEGFLSHEDGLVRGKLTPNFLSFLAAFKFNVDESATSA